MSIIRVDPSVLDRIRDHAASTYPYECCGAMIGTAGSDEVVVTEALELPNVVSASGASLSEPRTRRAPDDEGPRRRFRVSPDDYRQSEAHARKSGADLVGFYHSHPDHPAEPSQYDLDHAWPNFSYVIVSVRAGRPADWRSWRLKADRSSFVEETAWQPQS